MTTVLAPRPDTAALYPPTVAPRRTSMSLPRFLVTFVRNPLRVLPEAVYHEPIVQFRSTVTWVTDPDLIKRVLLDPTGAVTRAYRVVGTPTVVLIARDGTLVGKAISAKEWTGAAGRDLLGALLAR